MYKRQHRYQLTSSATSKWSVPGWPLSLSVTPSGNLLVTCKEPNKLVELSADSGESVREIALQADIEHPHHSVELTTGHVACHGYGYASHRLCVVGDDGKVACSYSGQGDTDDEQVIWPRYLAVDEDSQFMFVADEVNSRVVLLHVSPSEVKFECSVPQGVSGPVRLYFHQATRRLFVGQFEGGVSVIQLLK